MPSDYESSLTLKKRVDRIRAKKPDFIAVSNREWYSLFRDEIRNSIAIEGVFANRNDLRDVLERNKRTNKEKTAAILGYFEAASSMYEYASNQYKESEFVLRLSDIKQVHTLLMRYEKQLGTYSGDIGEFRKGNIEVAQATFRPIDVYSIRKAMTLLVKWFNAQCADPKVDKILLAAIVHAWFETIHPFRDGNGRSGRILLSYLLIGAGFVNVAIKGISRRDRETYYNALEACDDCFEQLHTSIEQGEAISLGDVDVAIADTDFSVLADMFHTSLQDTVTRLQQQDRKHPRSGDGVPLRELAQLFDYSQDYLRNLINRGNLKAEKRGKLWYARVGDMHHYLKGRKKS